MDYQNYLKNKQSMFVIRCQMMNIEFCKNQNLNEKIVNSKKFDLIKENLEMNEVYKG